MTVAELFDEYTKLTNEERQEFLAKTTSWLIKRVEERQKLEQEKTLNKDVPNS